MTATDPAMTESATPPPASRRHALASLLCDLLPSQGHWSDDAYLWLTDYSNRLIEFTDGRVEELSMPTDTHQVVLLYLYDLFRAWLKPRGGVVMVATLRMRIREGKFREPDLLMLPRPLGLSPPGPLLAGCGPGGRGREPGRPGIGIWWRNARTTSRGGSRSTGSPTPRDETITVLVLAGDVYVEHGVFGRGGTATSPLLEGFAADVSAVFDAPESGA